MIGKIARHGLLLTEEDLLACVPRPRRRKGYRDEVARQEPHARAHGIVCEVTRCTEPGIMALGDMIWLDQPVVEYEFLRGRWFCYTHFLWVDEALSPIISGKWSSGAHHFVETLSWRTLRKEGYRPCGHDVEYAVGGALMECRVCAMTVPDWVESS